MARNHSSSPLPEDRFDLNELPVVEAWTNAATRRADRLAAPAQATYGETRPVDAVVCPRIPTTAEIELTLAMQQYKKDSGRLYPTWSEVLAVLQDLGYHKSDEEPSDV
ncbi:hypothetical protein SAMN05444166_1729 [Singulisphaera sp. GP187]|uniref:hypothetical protein n=1 Tax=Singulisphaera sp. GP187 TaxID=1882752 RepID=UPI0009272FA7|nr:hypothetical protein [Singulisphaera sp. GP187]SIN94550.1 hypothetical protein SAMN05444166_1729 [Singulisphaera sp. GP187]